jgi:hypothetical protein
MKSFALTLALFLPAACAGARANSTATPYPLETCLVTGNTLGSMGDPVSVIRDGRELKFCCSPCVEEFDTDREFFLAKLTGR